MEHVGQVRSDMECNQNGYLICYRIAQTRAKPKQRRKRTVYYLFAFVLHTAKS